MPKASGATTETGSVFVIIPNWNGKASIAACLDSLQQQTLKPKIIVVDNGSVDDSVEFIQKNYPAAEIIPLSKNHGFAGGVNVGIKSAMDNGAKFVALFNNDAVADKNWLKELVECMEVKSEAGIVTGKLLAMDKKIDSTGEGYSNWGLPFPRGRGEKDSGQYDNDIFVFGASGGASLYRISMLEQIGLFDEDFFAYYEDVDLSFRAQLAGWKVVFTPLAIAYHQIGATSGKIKGFTTYQTFKNLPMLLVKNMPRPYLFKVGWRYLLSETLFFMSAVKRGQGWAAFRGDFKGTYFLFTSWSKRRKIQRSKKVSNEYIWSILSHDLPPNALKQRALRAKWWKLSGRKA